MMQWRSSWQGRGGLLTEEETEKTVLMSLLRGRAWGVGEPGAKSELSCPESLHSRCLPGLLIPALPGALLVPSVELSVNLYLNWGLAISLGLNAGLLGASHGQKKGCCLELGHK